MSDISSAATVPTHSPQFRTIFFAIITGFVFGAAGVIVSLHILSERLIPHILTSNEGIEFQEIIGGRPIPHLLDWSFSRIGLLNEMREVSPWVVAFGALIFVTLWLMVVKILNPTFHPLIRRATSIVEPESHTIESEALLETEDKPVNAPEKEDPDPADMTLSPIPMQLTTPERVLTSTHISLDRIHLEQAVRILLVVGLPVFAVWYVTGAFGNEPLVGRGHQSNTVQNWIGLLRYVFLGIGVFAGYSRHGLAGQFGILHRAYQSDEAVAPVRQSVKLVSFLELTMKGSVFGCAVWALEKCSFSSLDADLLDRFQALGTFNISYFNMLAWPFIGSQAIVWFSAGSLIYLLGKPNVRFTLRAALACLPVVGALAMVGAKSPLSRSAMAACCDATDAVLASAKTFDQKRPTASVPSGYGAAVELARRTPLIVLGDKPAPFKDMVVFDPSGTFEVEIDELTDDGLITEHSKSADVNSFLDKRRFRSALSWAAVKYVFNDANIRFDQSAEIRSGLDDLERAPHMLNTGETMRAIFFICSASPQNLAMLDEYADETKFAHPTRESQRMMGDLYTRFGEVRKALAWYRRAEMPHSFIEQVSTEKPLFHAGTVTGKLMWNGAPLAGVQVGAAPQRLNGLPRDLRPAVLHYDEELAGFGPDPSPLFSRYHPRPFHLRWIMGGATTAADGSFTLEDLTEGEYILVCTLPEGVKLTPPADQTLSIQRRPAAFTLSYDYPRQDLGPITFTRK